MIGNKNIKNIAFLLSTLTLATSTLPVIAKSKEGGGAGIKFDHRIMEYKTKKEFEEYNGNDKIEELLSKVDSMKDSGEWSLDQTELDFKSRPKNNPGNYPTEKGTATGTDAWKNSLDLKYIKKNPEIDKYLQQPMSERARLMLIAGSTMLGWQYSQKKPQRTTHGSGETDCSGFVYLACDAAGLQAPGGSTGDYPTTKTAYQVPWEEKQPGDILWRVGHVEMYIGKDENGVEMCMGAHQWGVPAKIGKVGGRGARAFTHVYRIKSRDLPLTSEEKQKLQSMGS